MDRARRVLAVVFLAGLAPGGATAGLAQAAPDTAKGAVRAVDFVDLTRYAGRWYEVNRYSADLLRQAVRLGYDQGYRAGEADRYDGWRYDYRNNFAYIDANYGYYGYYVDQAEYNHYFRQAFRRGYEDGYGRGYRYGRYDDGNYVILASVLQAILGLHPY